MSWLFGDKKRRPPLAERSTEGRHRSQALAMVIDHLARRPGSAVLDLGPSSNETLAFVGRDSEVVIADLFRSCAQGGTGGLTYRSAEELPLPEGRESFDAILVWDLLHYIAPGERPGLGRRLAELSRPGAHMLIVASWAAPIPPTPVHYRILDRDHLAWHMPEGRRLPAPAMVPRMVEKVMPGFTTERVFQLTTGLQEVVLSLAGAAPAGELARQSAAD